ncbi:MAG TPA: hypothetical protein PLJ74_05240 [Myxococcota bacterium]|nr:hypothetical protein [Myxococcota bacterium]
MRYILIFIFTFSIGILFSMRAFEPRIPTTSRASVWALDSSSYQLDGALTDAPLTEDSPPMESLDTSDQQALQTLLDLVD